MKFTIKTETLKKWLNIVNHATASITTTPILESILIKVNFKNVVLISNNLEMAIEHVISENVEIWSEWSICVPSKLLTSYISLINDDNIDFKLIWDTTLQIKTPEWKIEIRWNDSNDFPLIPSIKEETSLELKWEILKKSIEKTLFSSAEWNIRPTLAWILVNIDANSVTFASTDSFRLSEYKTDMNSDNSTEFSQIIPSKTSSQIRSILEDESKVKIISWNNQIVFISWNTKIYSRLLNWKFPGYSSFFPKTFSTKAEVNRIDLIWALKKINLLSRENNYSIKMSLSAENGILLETSETQIGQWDVKVVWVVEWEDNIVWINSTYFIEALWVIESTHISISFESPLSPILITPIRDPENKKSLWEFKHIIMPLKI